MEPVGKVLIVSGLLLLSAGILVVIFGKVPFIGKLPGDFVIKREGFTFYFPLATSILLSIVLSLIFWIFRR